MILKARPSGRASWLIGNGDSMKQKYELARWLCGALAGAASTCIFVAISSNLHSPAYDKAVAQLLICLIFLSAFLFASHNMQDFRFQWIIKTVTSLAAIGTVYAFCKFMEAYQGDLGKLALGAVVICVVIYGVCLKSEKQLVAQRKAEELESDESEAAST